MVALSDIAILTVSSALLAVALVRAYGPGDSAPNNAQLNTQASQTQQVQQQNTQQTSQVNNTTSNAQQIVTNGTNAATDLTNQATSGVQNTTTATSANQNQLVLLTYTVQSGDTLSKIAAQFGTSVSRLQELNNLSNSRILVGQRLLYPKP